MGLSDLLTRLEQDGLLLMSDAKLPSVVSCVVGGPIRGSWWSHPRGREIYALLQQLEAHEDVLSAKLVDKKVTFVHRRLWPAFLSIARAREPWQLLGLSKPARDLLASVDAAGLLTAHGAQVKELELRLLVHAAQVHVQSGAHSLVLTSWTRWARRHGPLGRSIPTARAKQGFRAIFEQLNERHHAAARLPFDLSTVNKSGTGTSNVPTPQTAARRVSHYRSARRSC